MVSKKQVYSCGHANGMTYDSTNNQIVCANGGEHLFVVYDANTFKKVKIVKYPTGYSINNISYDPDTKIFWATRAGSNYSIINFDKDLNKKSELISNLESFDNEVDIVYDSITIPLAVNISETNETSVSSFQKTIVFADTEKVLKKVKNSSSPITTDNIKVNKEGNYEYVIYQEGPHLYNKNQVKYELGSKIVNATVEVTADENNKLQYTITYDGEDSATISNKYTDTTEEDTVNIYSNTEAAKDLETEATLFKGDVPIATAQNDDGKYVFSNIQLREADTNQYTIQQLPYNSSKWDIDDSTLNVEVEAYEDEDGMIQYYVEFVDQRNAFTNIDDTIEGDKSSEDEISVPQTLFNKNKWIIIIGFIMLLSGTAVIYKNTYNP